MWLKIQLLFLNPFLSSFSITTFCGQRRHSPSPLSLLLLIPCGLASVQCLLVKLRCPQCWCLATLYTCRPTSPRIKHIIALQVGKICRLPLRLKPYLTADEQQYINDHSLSPLGGSHCVPLEILPFLLTLPPPLQSQLNRTTATTTAGGMSDSLSSTGERRSLHSVAYLDFTSSHLTQVPPAVPSHGPGPLCEAAIAHAIWPCKGRLPTSYPRERQQRR